jgi:hypothetical protein
VARQVTSVTFITFVDERNVVVSSKKSWEKGEDCSDEEPNESSEESEQPTESDSANSEQETIEQKTASSKKKSKDCQKEQNTRK